MISPALTRRAKELGEAGAPFVVATVVRVQRPTSVAAGDGALVLGDGTIEGFVGGVCAQHSVRLYALQAIESGQPLMLRILPDAVGGAIEGAEEDPAQTVEVGREDGVVTVQNPCLSGGAIELFLEPVLPAPRVLVYGDSPIVGALRRIGPELGLAMVAGDTPAAGDLALIVAAHGRDEIGALRAGVESGIPYVGLVASHKRGAALIEELRSDGLSEELVGRIETPAGLDIGARSAAEIALSILARIVSVRRAGGALRVSDVRATTAVDPVCGMTIVVGADTPSLQHAGQPVYFCCLGCKLKFEERSGDLVVA